MKETTVVAGTTAAVGLGALAVAAYVWLRPYSPIGSHVWTKPYKPVRS